MSRRLAGHQRGYPPQRFRHRAGARPVGVTRVGQILRPGPPMCVVRLPRRPRVLAGLATTRLGTCPPPTPRLPRACPPTARPPRARLVTARLPSVCLPKVRPPGARLARLLSVCLPRTRLLSVCLRRVHRLRAHRPAVRAGAALAKARSRLSRPRVGAFPATTEPRSGRPAFPPRLGRPQPRPRLPGPGISRSPGSPIPEHRNGNGQG